MMTPWERLAVAVIIVVGLACAVVATILMATGHIEPNIPNIGGP